MHHFIADAPRDERAVLRVARDWGLDPMARQYCGALGKQENCQMAVSVSMVQRLAALLVLQPHLDRLYEASSAAPFTAEDLGLRA